MSSNKIVVSICIVGLVALGHIPSNAGEQFTIEQYLGVWYDVAVLSPYDIPSHASPISCQWSNVTGRNGEKSFNEVFTFIFRRRPIISQGNGTLVNAEIRIVYAAGEGGSSEYKIQSYNDGRELILRDKKSGMYSAFVSRNTTVSAEAMAGFEKLAVDSGGYVHYLNNSLCPDIN